MGDKTNKKSKFLIFASIIGFLGIVCCVVALAFGALSKDKWLDASKRLRVAQGLHETPVFVQTTLSVLDASKLELEVSGGILTVDYYDGEEILVEYYENYKDEADVFIENNKLIIRHDLNFGSLVNFDCHEVEFTVGTGVDWILYKEYLDVKISLPGFLEFSSAEIDVSGGSAYINGIVLGETKINASGGIVKLAGCRLTSVEKIHISGGYAEIKDSLVENVRKIDVSGGEFSLNGGALSGKTQVYISGGIVNLKNLDVNPDSVGFDISTSGGRVYFNGTRIRGTYYPTLPVSFDVHISGGRLDISTK